ncbi:DNA replication licensing factor MCM6 [Portunus trituberculatus]|uniref:DNA replication licensing factor MCM6 n=1 Tax=Portunus trituberculatus TaxID=210409 RepID=A0A5B7E9C0_PORTR|nr:DNA replication licensing factor MCM6 [Portunus trituberculatus]
MDIGDLGITGQTTVKDEVGERCQKLFQSFLEEVYPFLCLTVRNHVRDNTGLSVEKEYYLSIVDVPTRHKVRELSTLKVGTLIRISGQDSEGVTGLKALGVRDLSYRLAFLACSVEPTNPKFGGKEVRGEETTAESIKRRMTDLEWNKVYEMAKDKNLYQNLITSLFPTIYGNDEIKRGASGCVFA